jgi:vancomycin permeability regulator SanA
MRIFRRKWLKRTLIVTAALGVTAVVAALLVNQYVIASAKKRIVTQDEAAEGGYDCILVLGAGVRDSGEPSQMLEDRLITGIELYERGAADKIIMSGDHGRAGYDEVNVMKEYAVTAGVPSEDVFMDHAGFSTYESLYRARDVFLAEKVLIVTQKYHLYRALYFADKLGLEGAGVKADIRLFPQQAAYDRREFLARNKDFFYTLLRPEPTYLGDAIPVTGNGDQTNDK